jgi:prepilin-type processing-associated H-X9-DG protein
VFKRGNIGHPSDRWIWIESSDARGENIGAWEMNINGTQANGFQGSSFEDGNDAPGVFHISTSNFNYCDGHADVHKWANAPALLAYGNNGTGTPAPADAMWVAQHYAGLQNP